MTNRVFPRALLACLVLLGVNVAPALAFEPCPNQQARNESNINPSTGSPYSTQLPDCRAYELVSPPDTGGYPVASVGEKEGGEVTEGTRIAQVTRNGAVVFASRALPAATGALPNGRSVNVFASERGSGGWSTTDLTPSSTPGDEDLVAAAPDGRSALVFTEASLVAADLDNPLGVIAPQEGAKAALDLYLVGRATPPQLVSHGALPRTVPAEPIVHKQVEPPFVFNAELSAVGFTTGGAPLVSAASAAAKDCYSWADVGARSAVLTNPDNSNPANCELLGMTPDGRAIFKDVSGDSYNGGIFVDSVGSEVLTFPLGSVYAVQLSAPSSTSTTFDGVSPDGKLAYVTTAYPLGGEERGSEPDVYSVNVPAAPVRRTPLEPPGTAGGENTVVCLSCEIGGGGAATFISQSADGSHVFFEVAEVPGEPAGHPYKGLWSWDRNSKTASRLTDATDVEQLVPSEDGQYAVGLTKQLANNLNGTADVYEFSAPEKQQLIASAGVSADTYQLTGQHGIGTEFPPTAGGVSDDGQLVVYDDQPPAANGQLPPETAQEWNGGPVPVQLSPRGAKSSYYVLGTAGPELEDVFFTAYEPLVPADRNAGTQDIYDARVQGGFPPCTVGNPNPPPGSSSCSPATSTPNPQPPAPSPYTAGLGLAAFSLPALPADTSHPASVAKPLTRAQKLAKALKACKKDKRRSTRLACEKSARKKYGTTAKKSAHRKGRK